MVRISKQGGGLTETDVFHFDHDNMASEDAALFAEMVALGTPDGRLRAIELACVDVLAAAGLPTGFGVENGLVANEPWPILKRRGYAPDSREGFAAKMIGDIHWLRHCLAKGDHDRAMMFMFYLGVKWSASGIKERHANKSHPVGPRRGQARDVGLAQEFQRRSAGSGMSATALKADVGRRAVPPLRRSAAIDAIDRGLKILSGERAKPDA